MGPRGIPITFKHDPIISCSHAECLCRLAENQHEILEKIEERVGVATAWAKAAVAVVTFFTILSGLIATL